MPLFDKKESVAVERDIYNTRESFNSLIGRNCNINSR